MHSIARVITNIRKWVIKMTFEAYPKVIAEMTEFDECIMIFY